MSDTPDQSWDQLVAASALALAKSDEPGVIANGYLHPLNGHPNALNRYAMLLAGRSPFAERARSLLQGRAIEFSALVRPSPLFQGDKLPEQTDVLFVSHFLQAPQAADGRDLYFGHLPLWLKERGLHSVTALINHSRKRWDELSPVWTKGETPRVLLSRTSDFRTERQIARRLAGGARQLSQMRPALSSAFERQFLEHALAHTGASHSRTALRIALQVRHLVRQLKPRMLVSTYEGHSWERLAFQAARQENPDIICVGYHHALLFPFTTAMARRLGHSYDPDQILTAGDNATEWLKHHSAIGDIPIATMGSVRTSAKQRSPEAVESQRTCLVIPEGTVEETLRLAEFAAAAARRLPEVTFRMRLHPVIDRDRLIKQHPELQTYPPNFVWSTQSLDEDISTSRWALYRGTTAVIATILAGIKPFYYHASGINIDPLKSLGVWRETVSKATEFVERLGADLACDTGTRQADFEAAAQYCQRCFAAFDPAALLAILSPGTKQ